MTFNLKLFFCILLQSASSPVLEITKKKPKFKRRLDFSAADYKSKKKIRVKSSFIIPLTPVSVKHTSSGDQVMSDEEVNISSQILVTRVYRFLTMLLGEFASIHCNKANFS